MHGAPATVSLVIHPRRQPTRTTCGQTCVAILTGAPVDEVCRLMGARGATSTHQLQAALAQLGWRCAQKLVPLRRVEGLVPVGIVSLRDAEHGRAHWVVWYDGYYVDPVDGLCWAPEDFVPVVESAGWKVTSILPLERVAP